MSSDSPTVGHHDRETNHEGRNPEWPPFQMWGVALSGYFSPPSPTFCILLPLNLRNWKDGNLESGQQPDLLPSKQRAGQEHPEGSTWPRGGQAPRWDTPAAGSHTASVCPNLFYSIIPS